MIHPIFFFKFCDTEYCLVIRISKKRWWLSCGNDSKRHSVYIPIHFKIRFGFSSKNQQTKTWKSNEKKRIVEPIHESVVKSIKKKDPLEDLLHVKHWALCRKLMTGNLQRDKGLPVFRAFARTLTYHYMYWVSSAFCHIKVF